MASTANLKSSGREAALARRKAMSSQGKQGVRSSSPERTRGAAASQMAPQPTSHPAAQTPEIPQTSAAPASPTAATHPAPVLQVNAASSPANSSRELARKRRTQLASQGRRAMRSGDRVRSADAQPRPNQVETAPLATPTAPAVAAAPAPAMAPSSIDPSLTAALNNKQATKVLAAKPKGRMLSLARRAAQSTRGKHATKNPQSAASMARTANPELSGRELAQQVRSQRSTQGGAGEKRSAPCGRMRPKSEGAADQPWKVGVSETASGSSVTGTRVGRSQKTTGDEPSTCRNVTGTEYMGAEIFREFCQSDPAPGLSKVSVTSTGYGNAVTGNELGRSTKVTGDEPGSCRNVTGTAYLSNEHFAGFCQTPSQPGPRKFAMAETRTGKPVSGAGLGSDKVTGTEQGAKAQLTGTQYTSPSEISKTVDRAPSKVMQSTTLSGRSLTGTRVGRSERVTGDEAGSCRFVTGDEYVDLSQYQACNRPVEPEASKVGVSATLKGQRVSGTQTGRSGKVTGDEPGTCKAVTGTPYAGFEQAKTWCEPNQQQEISARTRQLAATPGPRMTGIQPGIDGPLMAGKLTGAAKGACEPLTGTPYVGADQFAEACGGAAPSDSDYPQAMGVAQGFSVTSPARQSAEARPQQGVTGTVYESSRHITGPFGMADGKITGTEQARFDTPVMRTSVMPMPAAAGSADELTEAQGSRITGEGQTAGPKVTGDDWERGDRVTGTEGASARRRNPTRPGSMGAMPSIVRKRNEEAPKPESRVTGGVGNTDRGALITYSGGARG